MKRFLLFLLILPCAAPAQKPDPRIDSLQKLLVQAKADTQKVNLLNKLANVHWDTEFPRCLKNATDAINLATKIKFYKGLSQAYLNRGDVYYGKLVPDSAITDYKRGISIAYKSNNPQDMAYGYNDLAVILRTQGRHADAVVYFLKAADIYERIHDLNGSANSWTHLANNYNHLEQFDKALAAYQKAYELRVKLNLPLVAAQSLAGIGMTYRNKELFAKGTDKKNFKLAVRYFDKALKTFIELKHPVNIGLCYKELGITYLQVEDYPNTLKNLLPAEKIFTEIGFKRELGSLYKGIGLAYMHLKQFDKAKHYLDKGLQASIDEHYEQHIKESYEALYSYYKMTGNDKKSLEYHEKFELMKDSLAKVFNFEKLAETTTKYEAEKKQHQINLLSKENTIQKLSISKQKTTTGIVAGVFLATVAFGGMAYSRKQLKQKALMQTKMLEQQDVITKAVLDAEENERKRIASDLHDGVGQLFSAVKLNMNGLFDRITLDREEDRFLAENTLALVDESCKEVRIISHRMMPNMLLRSGIASDLKSFIEKIDGDSLKVTLEATGFKDRLESNVETMLYRVIQETVANVIKHAAATRLDILLNRDKEGITATVTDNGKGFDTTQIGGFSGIGLKNIITRIEYLKGSVDYDSTPGKGTAVNIWVPVA
ncbi:MAG: sensor histidine kinase [Mucilaginibacter sp.]